MKEAFYFRYEWIFAVKMPIFKTVE